MRIHSFSDGSPERDRSLLYIAVGVISAHGLFLFWIAYLAAFTPKVEQVKRIAVQTVQLSPPPAKVESIVAVADPTPPPMEEPPPPPAQKAEKPQVEAEPEPKEEPKPKEEPPLPIAIEEESPPTPKPAPKKEAPAPKPKPLPKPKPTPKPKPPAKPTPKPAAKKEAPAPKPAAEKKAAPKPPEKKEVKQEEPAVAAVDPEAEKAKKRRQELLSNAQQSIAKIGETRDKMSSAKSNAVALAETPALIEALTIDSIADQNGNALDAREIGYADELAQRLKMQLKLAEHGEVRIKLTLDRSGRFVKLVVVNSRSKKNQAYIEKTIPTLHFPAFGDRFGTAKEYTFVISLNNDL